MATSKQVSAKKDKRTFIALLLIIGPTVIIVGTFLMFSFVNWALYGLNTGGSNALSVTINIFLYLFGLIGVIAWLPGLVTGIIMLTTKK